MKLRLKTNKDRVTIEESDEFLGKMLTNVTGKVYLKTPLGKREVKIENKNK